MSMSAGVQPSHSFSFTLIVALSVLGLISIFGTVDKKSRSCVRTRSASWAPATADIQRAGCYKDTYEPAEEEL